MRSQFERPCIYFLRNFLIQKTIVKSLCFLKFRDFEFSVYIKYYGGVGDIENKKLFRSKDNFIFFKIRALKNIEESNEFRDSDIFRLIYLSSLIGRNNVLMSTERTILNFDSLKQKMRLSDTEFYRFYSLLIKNNIILENKGKLVLDSNIAVFGEIKDKYCGQFIKIYVDNIRYLYERAEPREHKRLSMLYRLALHLHTKYNIVCSNIFETEKDKIKPLKIKELSAIFKYNELSFKRLIKYLSALKDENNIPVLKIRDGSIVISPKIMYGSYTAYALDEWIELNALFDIDIL